MPPSETELERQLGRQSTWLKDSWLWLLRTRLGIDDAGSFPKPSALDVGCGPGIVIQVLSSCLNVTGLDINPDMVSACKAKGFDAIQGPGESLPFDDESFDVVYCSFLLLWVRNPVRIVLEMKRVSRQWVLCLAEPDYGARISYPKEVAVLDRLLMEGIEGEGGDPLIGRKLRSVFAACELDTEVGIHPGVWDIERLRKESDDEWQYIEMTVDPNTDPRVLDSARRAWKMALNNGDLFQFNPVFWAIGKK